MKIFYSSKENTFFNEVFHGPRTIEVPDPEWRRPIVKIPDPDWIRPSNEVPTLAWGGESQPETTLGLDVDALAPMIDVPDSGASAPLIVVPNPQCLLPPEAELVEISQAEHAEIFRLLAMGGSILVPGKKGRPSIAPSPEATAEELESRERTARARALQLTDPLIARHRDELEVERPTTLTAEQYTLLQGYRQDLRDWPESGHFPQIGYRPEPPTWLAEQL
ncbi:hypothetical protein BLL37_20070 [Pseudomonas azotoformans]|uniref:Phage tail protein n=1 Tax=Pseudomonas azotoformans TaxID=47878 RepID=A0A1V2JBJ1_PSEAZ|nr:hypothetical protein [Pseudomonas azotoformans]OIN52579.1 hypothetical protein BFL39_02280 [Pseudomonas azotoformans]ONH42783.1 hypothetical protein BLL37_20070 [Pseudomonas azotoformans]SDO83460.1 hypothetical protein SAMN04489799_5631 [Pseudomonas azotoformans]